MDENAHTTPVVIDSTFGRQIVDSAAEMPVLPGHAIILHREGDYLPFGACSDCVTHDARIDLTMDDHWPWRILQMRVPSWPNQRAKRARNSRKHLPSYIAMTLPSTMKPMVGLHEL